MVLLCVDDWEREECDTEKLTGLEDFGVLLRPLGLSERKLSPDPIPFIESDPLGALVTSAISHGKAAFCKGNRFLWSYRQQFCAAVKRRHPYHHNNGGNKVYGTFPWQEALFWNRRVPLLAPVWGNRLLPSGSLRTDCRP